MGSMGQDLSNNPEVINTIAANLRLDPSSADGMNKIMQYAQHWGAWKWCFWLPAGFAVLGAAWIFFGLRDDPRSVGLPELPGTNIGKSDDEKPSSASRSAFLRVMVWTNRWIWTLCIANVFVYVMRMGILDWGPKFLTEARGMTIEDAAWAVAAFEIFAIIGTIFSGWATDHLFKGKAHRMCLICMLAASAFMSIFIFLPDLPMLISILSLAMAGFFIYGPQALIGQSGDQGSIGHSQRPGRHLRLCRLVPVGYRCRHSGRPLGLERGLLSDYRHRCPRRGHLRHDVGCSA